MRGAATKAMSDIVEERQQSRYARPLKAVISRRTPAGSSLSMAFLEACWVKAALSALNPRL